MKPRTLALLFTSAALLGPLAPLASAQRDSEFMKEFRQALAADALDAMVALVREYEQEAVLAVVETCEAIGKGSNDQLETEIDGLRRAWQAAFDSNFVMRRYEYIALLSGVFKNNRAKLMEQYQIKLRQLDQARADEDKGVLPAVGMDMLLAGEGFEEAGDFYMASVCYLNYAECFDEPALGEDADLKRACEGYGFCVELRERAELRDSVHARAKERFDKLEYDGYGDPSKGPEARAAARAKTDVSYAPTPIGATFELVPEIDEFERLIFFGDTVYQVWMPIVLGANGSSGTIPTLEHSPTVMRNGAVKAAIDADGNGEAEVEIPLTGTISPVRFTLGSGDEAREWAFLATIGHDRDTFQGIQPWNLAPADEILQIYMAPAASVVGAIGDVRVQIFDDNMDGVYGSLPRPWALGGMREGDSQQDLDAILIGDAKRVVPWSELIQVGDAWYRLEHGDGVEVIATKQAEMQTGTLKLDFKGLKPDWIVMRGTNAFENVFVELAAAGKKGVEVPAGTYTLFSGRVSKGRRDQMVKALVVPSTNTPTWRVQAGGSATVELGAPFGFDFDFKEGDGSVTIEGSSIVVTGRGKETYQRFWNCVPHPEASVRRAGSKKGTKGEKFKLIESMEQLNEQGNYDGVWFPYDLTLDAKWDDSEVQLVEKKNKLFGKVTSDWKGN